MEICPNPKGQYYPVLFILAVGLVSILIITVWGNMPPLLSCAILIVAWAFRYSEAYGKKVIMDAEGCTITFLWYHKRYSWNDFVIKRVEDYKDAISHPVRGETLELGEGAFFSVINRRPRRKRTGPGEYCMLKKPLKSFYVLFNEGKKNYPNPYVIDKTVFLETLEKWGVELEMCL